MKQNYIMCIIDTSKFLNINFVLEVLSYSAGRVVSVCSCVTEENAHFVHRHRLDLLPPTHPNQQLVKLQLMGVSTKEEAARTYTLHHYVDELSALNNQQIYREGSMYLFTESWLTYLVPNLLLLYNGKSGQRRKGMW